MSSLFYGTYRELDDEFANDIKEQKFLGPRKYLLQPPTLLSMDIKVFLTRPIKILVSNRLIIHG